MVSIALFTKIKLMIPMGNMKKLYAVTVRALGLVKYNPFPSQTDKVILANDFLLRQNFKIAKRT